jgi:type IV pilus assembly protein PilW
MRDHVHAAATAAGRQAGLTVVEIMVGAAIGLFLVAVMGSMFLGSKTTFNHQNHLARLQENGRFAVEALSTDLRMAGFRGCRGSTAATFTNTLNDPNTLLYNHAQGVWASHHNGTAWVPALSSQIQSPALSPAPAVGGDVLTVRRVVGPGLGLITEMASATAALSVSAGSAVALGDWLLVSDCSGAAVFQATNNDAGSTGSIEHDHSAALTPGMSTSSLGRPYLRDALVHRLAAVTYYVAASQRSGKTHLNALWSYTTPSYDGSVQPQELVTGVDGFAVRLGLDTNSDGAADAYSAPTTTLDWTQVVSAQVELVLVSADDRITTTAQPYLFGGNTVTPTDRRLRTVMSVTTSVRNALR